ncbi:heat shock protein Hsp15 [Moraxella cuniculi DSM 21768]|uniref:Heat shock protein 15 n=1 Tax=Moraxella cuniculi DSM 21768 TaxID=1122245 RepID=A0A1N7F1P4_9GAMM|nr:S4 domain-containing protein [Moraxella cuniculi]OOS05066.1 RNA-binding protein [Moraxella cuniculi]SIR94132.1 heat shock protein Hsp15 [Moraxella cuniculi DSM 21768]
MNPSELTKVRADKWLWAARFFRTRSLAKEAIESGKVQINNAKIKVSRELQIGDTLTIRQGHATRLEEKTIIIKQLSENRGNATIAATLYEETEESRVRREFMAQQRKLDNLARPDTRPSKKDRRELQKLKNNF